MTRCKCVAVAVVAVAVAVAAAVVEVGRLWGLVVYDWVARVGANQNTDKREEKKNLINREGSSISLPISHLHFVLILMC